MWLKIKKFFQGNKTKLIHESLIFPQRDFFCWWNLHLNMLIILTLSWPVENLQLLDAGLFKYVWPFVPPGKKGLREWNICKTKNFEIKVCELDLQNEKIVEIFRASRFLLHLLFYLWALFYSGEYHEKGTQNPERTQDPGLYEDPGTYEDPGPMRTQDRRRTQDTMRTQDPTRTQDPYYPSY